MSQVVVVFLIIIVFLAVLGTLQAIWWLSLIRRDEASQDMLRRLGTVTASPEEVGVLLRREVADRWVFVLGSIGTWIYELNQQAGRPHTMRGIGLSVGGFALIGVAIMAFLLRSPTAIIGLMGGAVPILLLSFQAEKRARLLSEQLPDALDLVGRSLQAGHGISDSLRLAAEELEQPLAGEMGRVYEENNLGMELRVCLENLVDRNIRNFDLTLFAASVIMQQETGGNLVEILQAIAATIRARFTLQAKVKALTAEARLSAWILGLLPMFVAVMIFLVRPSYLGPLFADPIGKYLLLFAFGSYVIGIYSMTRISKLES